VSCQLSTNSEQNAGSFWNIPSVRYQSVISNDGNYTSSRTMHFNNLRNCYRYVLPDDGFTSRNMY
jgi:hypothetical protein